ncbi:MAG: GatB/YqeY protein [Candidatus Saccharibacteria bacterium]|nr:GatB/YqeY protein [Candidatus Saccharibacteria bacterium]
MTLVEQLTEDMKASMKAGDTDRLNVVRLLRGAMKNEEIKLGHPLEEAEALKVLQREAKQRRDSVEAYRSAGRDDLQKQEESELEIIGSYLPEAMSEDELAKVVDEVIAETGATDMKQMGAVIGGVMKRVGAKAEGGLVSKLVRERLGS